MANDKVSKRVEDIATAAVIEALGGEGSGLAAELTADILNKKVGSGGYSIFSDYMTMFSGLRGGEREEMSYIEYLAREQIKLLVKKAVVEWFAAHEAGLKTQITERISADRIADSYLDRLHNIFEEGTFSIDIDVERARDESSCDD